MTGTPGAPCLVWFQQDLRLSDNPALAAALERNSPVIPVYVWAPEEEGAWPPGSASKWWLRRSLAELSAALADRGSRLIVRRGPTQEALRLLAVQTGAAAVFWNRRYEPAAVCRDGLLKEELRSRGIQAESFNGNLLFEPRQILNQSGQPFRIFTAFWRACQSQPLASPSKDAPKRLPAPGTWPRSLDLSELSLEPVVDWASGFREMWRPGESGAWRQINRFLEEALTSYPINRDQPGVPGTSRLSPHLHFGEVSPGQVWRAAVGSGQGQSPACQAYLRQIGWREFAYHLLYHHPESPQQELRPEFSMFPWQEEPALLKAWKRGRTGYPLVDAGMRELWRTGWMHNRVRMVVASFLVKHLLISWQQGAAWFWDTLVDADLANNTLGWQWVAGCGVDAAPYFRIFNPTIQAAKFDPKRDYLRRWVPELENGQSYPAPIVEHGMARARALDALASIKKR